MPKVKRGRKFGWVRRKAGATALKTAPLSFKTAHCFVCYSEYYPFNVPHSQWEGRMMKLFYHILHIAEPENNDAAESVGKKIERIMENGDELEDNLEEEEEAEDDDTDSIVSLPFCPACHSKISVMFSLYTQAQNLLREFDNIRDEVAFKIIECISENKTNGPMDKIRQDIFTRWFERYESKKESNNCALDLMAFKNAQQPIDKRLTGTKVSIKSNKSTNLNNSENSNKKYSEHDVSSDFENIESMMEMEIQDEGGESSVDENYYNNLTLAPNQVHVIQKGKVEKNAKYVTISTKDNQQLANNSKTPVPKMPKLIPMGKVPEGKEEEENSEDVETMVIEPAIPVEGANGKRKRTPKKTFTIPHGPTIKRNFHHGQIRKPGFVPKPGIKYGFPPIVKAGRGRPRRNIIQQPQLPLEPVAEIISEDTPPEDYLTTSGLYRCKLCPREYSEMSRLKRHESLCHPTSKKIRCEFPTCPKGFSSLLTMRRHMQNIHHNAVEGSIKCQYCNKTFIKKYSFELHLKIHPEYRMEEKRRAKIGFKRKAEEDEDVEETNDLSNEFQEDEEVKTETIDDEKEEIEEKHNSQPISECKICFEKFDYIELLNVHLASHNTTVIAPPGNFICDVSDCKKTFKREAEFKRHKAVAHKKRLACDYCTHFYYRIEHLDAHMKTHVKKRDRSSTSSEKVNEKTSTAGESEEVQNKKGEEGAEKEMGAENDGAEPEKDTSFDSTKGNQKKKIGKHRSNFLSKLEQVM